MIVGAGLAGLVCAKVLQEEGMEVTLLDAGSAPGGRVRTVRRPDGYVLDEGFQVLLDSYPAAREHLDIGALEPRYFQPGAFLAGDPGQAWEKFTNPWKQPWMLPASLRFLRTFKQRDKLRLAALAGSVLMMPDSQLTSAEGGDAYLTTEDYLERYGFSLESMDGFFRPFFGGVFLDESLKVNAKLFRYYFKKFLSGRALIPARGMQAIPEQLAAGLKPGTLHLDRPVRGVSQEGGRAAGVELVGGDRVEARYVVLATDQASTIRMVEPDPMPIRRFIGVACVYFSSARSLYEGRMLVLPKGRKRTVRHFCQLTNIAPELAPPGRHLLSVTVLEGANIHDEALPERCRAELAQLCGAEAATGLDHLATRIIPHALPWQGADFWSRLAPLRSPLVNGLYFAGDQAAMASIQGAMQSGADAAHALLRDVREGYM